MVQFSLVGLRGSFCLRLVKVNDVGSEYESDFFCSVRIMNLIGIKGFRVHRHTKLLF